MNKILGSVAVLTMALTTSVSAQTYLGNLTANPYLPKAPPQPANTFKNPYGRYGSKYSNDSINNPYGAGSQYNQDSPNNPYGNGLTIIGR